MTEQDREAGYILLHRQVLSSAIWQSVNDWRLAETILLKANWKPGTFQSRSGEVVEVQRGEMVTSLESLSRVSGLSIQSVRTSLAHLEKADFLTSRSTNHFRVISVVNYGKYQAPAGPANTQTNKDLAGTSQRYKAKKKDKTPPSPEAFELSDLLIELAANNGARPPQREKGAEDADRLIRLDARPLEEAKAVLRWSQADPFWKANILSVAKLREKYDTLRLQMQRSNPPSGNTNGAKNGSEHLYS